MNFAIPLAILASACSGKPSDTGGDSSGDTAVAPGAYGQGGWPIDYACNADLTVTGDAVGDVTAGTALLDQYGQTVDIHDFCSDAVLIVSTAGWSDWDVGNLNTVQADYASGLVVVVALFENADHVAATQADAAALAASTDATYPILADTESDLVTRFNDHGTIPVPTLLAPGAVVYLRDALDAADHISEVLPE